MNKLKLVALVSAALLGLSACGSVSTDNGTANDNDSADTETVSDGGDSEDGATDDGDASGDSYVNVVKLTGIAWFDRMAEGVDEFAEESGTKATQTGPSTDSPEQQISIIQGLIAKNPSGIGIVASDPGAVEAVIEQAMDAGIKVVTHEAPQLTSPDADIEAFDNDAYGSAIMESLAACMDGEGKYAQFVGKLTATTHMAWADAGRALQEAEYPNMELVAQPYEDNDNADTSYEKTKQILQTYPDIKGFMGSGSQAVPGIARAISEAGLEDEVCVYGTGVPSETAQYVSSGAIDEIFFWDPAAAGKAVMSALKMLHEGEELTDGMSLGVEGYESLMQSPDNPKVFLGSAQLSATKDTIDNFDF